MNTQDEKSKTPLTGANIAPKGHGNGCLCCKPQDDELDEEE